MYEKRDIVDFLEDAVTAMEKADGFIAEWETVKTDIPKTKPLLIDVLEKIKKEE